MNLAAKRYGKHLAGLAAVCALLFCLLTPMAGAAEGGVFSTSWYALTVRAEAMTLSEDGYAGAVTIADLCNGTNLQPLTNVTLLVRLSAEAVENGAVFTSVCVFDGDAVAVTVQPMDADGAFTGEQKTLSPKRAAELPQGTVQARLCYFSGEKDIRRMPAGTRTGKVTLETASLPGVVWTSGEALGAVEAWGTAEWGEAGTLLELPVVQAPLSVNMSAAVNPTAVPATATTAGTNPTATTNPSAGTATTAGTNPTATMNPSAGTATTVATNPTAVPATAPIPSANPTAIPATATATATPTPTIPPTPVPTPTPTPIPSPTPTPTPTLVPMGLSCTARTKAGAPVAGLSLTLALADGRVLSLMTDENGAASFADLSGGEAVLTATASGEAELLSMDGAAAASPRSASCRLSVEGMHSVEILCALYGRMEGSVSGQEAGAQVALASPDQQRSAAISPEGGFVFEQLPAGAYNVFVPLSEDAVLTGDSPWALTQSGDMVWLEAAVEEGQLLSLPGLAFAPAASVSGCAYADANSSLTREDGEPLMTGVTVRLQQRRDGVWTDVSATQTDEFGAYLFPRLSPGEYRVCAQSDAADYFAAAVGNIALYEGQAACGPELTLAAGDKLAGGDVSLQEPAMLSFTAFWDSNADGARGSYERDVMGVTVEVMDGDAPIATGVTDDRGQALVGGVRPGTYPLRVTRPTGYQFTVKGESCVGDTAEKCAMSDAFSFLPGQTTSAAAGVKPVGSFSGKVFEDLNNDGVMDESDPGVADVTLRLEREKTGTVYELTTDETGLFTFADLPDGAYLFSATLPQGMLYARYSKTGGDLRSVFTGSIVTREFIISKAEQVVNKNVGVVQKGVLKGTAFLDLNYNGYLDEGEPGYPGVTVEAIKISNNESLGKTVTDDNGAFRLENLRGGAYRLRAVLPNNGSIFTVTPAARDEKANVFAQRAGRRENSAEPYEIVSGGEAEALIGVAVGATVQGSVFLDADYDGRLADGEKRLSGVTVEAVDDAGNVAATAKTNNEGKYMLQGIMPGQYTIRFLRVAGYGFTRLRPEQEGGSHVVELLDGYGLTAAVDIAMGQAVAGVNAGMLPAATVTGVLFNDLNDDGLPSEKERGLDAAQVRLVSQDGEIDWTRNVGEDGTYFFDGVMPGAYTLTYLLPEHTEIAVVALGGNTLENKGRETVSPVFSVAMGEAYQCPLVGAVVLGNLRGVVYKDADADGTQLDGEKGLSGAIVTLTPNRKGLEEQTVTTGGDGTFQIDDLRPASYRLTVTLPKGYIFGRTAEGEKLTFDAANAQTLSCPWSVLTGHREQRIGAVKPASVSGAIWLDENRDGSRAKTEALLAGISLEMVDDATGKTALRTVSTETGFLFENVRPGTYTLRFILPRQAEPAADKASAFTRESMYMARRNVTVTEGQTLEGLTTGLVSQTSIGGTLILREGDAATPVAGVTVSLWQEGEGDALATAVSDEEGGYRFDGLWPGAYILRAELPDGMIFMRLGDPNYPENATVISASDGGTGSSAAFSLEMARHQLTNDVVYIKPAKIGNQVWLDSNKNGLIDGGEPMIPGVKLTLLADGKAAYETTSNAYGYYLFDQVYPGVYTLQAEAYPELTITGVVANLPIITNCLVSGDGKKAESGPITVKSGESNVNCNAGYQLRDGYQSPAAVTAPPGRDWSESNLKFDGIQEQQR